MHGFKSFPKKTEIPFTPGINVILGPNGSGKSNVSNALCFVLGRLSAKSMRAAKAKDLIFLGTKAAPPAKEAMVELVFDNSQKTFSIETEEISIKRVVRRNGQSIYKINNETKTRQEILTLLAQGGIDPNGFNIILQGEIEDFAKMHPEERRKIIEEVSGISIYESRKEKSIKELEKTEEKLKEVTTTLRERTIYLNNLEKERQQALKFKKLESDIKQFQASIIYHDLGKKKKDAERVNEEIVKKENEIEKIKKEISKVKSEISNLDAKITNIDNTVQKSTGLEQERLNKEIADLRASKEGLRVKIEHDERKLAEISTQKNDLNEKIRNEELSMRELQKESPSVVKKTKEIEEKKRELEKLEAERKKFYVTKSELKSMTERIEDKRAVLQSYINEGNFLIKECDNIAVGLFDKKTTIEKVNELKNLLDENKIILERINLRERELEKINSINEREIENQNKVIEGIAKMDICPLCKSKITDEHIKNIKSEVNPKIHRLKAEMDAADKELNEIYKRRKTLNQEIEQMQSEIYKREGDLVKLNEINNKKEQIKNSHEKTEIFQKEVEEITKKRKLLEESFDETSNIEQKYETARIELQEISLRTEETLNADVSFLQKELDRRKITLNQIKRNEDDINVELAEFKVKFKQTESLIESKSKQEEELSQKFRKLLEEKSDLQRKIKEYDISQINQQNNVRALEQVMNDSKIERARISAEVENLEVEMLEIGEVEIIKNSKEVLMERLTHAKEIISNIGSVNLRSLEMYDEIKKEYDKVNEKVETISKEKESILNVIHNIDIKKRKSFLKTFAEIDEIFSRNFSQLSPKGQVNLELENKKEPFEGGVGITVKMGQGKYFDVASLSGGEKTLVALSLIFAIQELKPYYFYILDEIDAALDKRNSERLAGLLKKYMQKGQYIVISHNDEVIGNATNLYGLSMFDGVTKIVSMKM